MLIKEIFFVFFFLCILLIVLYMFYNFSIFVWNVRGIMFFLLCLLNMFDFVKCDIVIIFEYKFKCDNVLYLDFVYFDYFSYVCIEFIGINIFIQCLCYLGKGGIVIMYKKEFELFICLLIDLDFICIIGIEFKMLCD